MIQDASRVVRFMALSGRRLIAPAALVIACSTSNDDGSGLLPGGAGAGQNPQGGAGPSIPSASGGSGSGITLPPAASGGRTGGDEPCERLECQQMQCSNGSSTTVSGTVYDPSGTLPLYNVMVYVPNAELQPLSAGAGCVCEVSGEPIASALTDTNGRFVIENVPVGADVPLVVQVGKWRRKFTIPNVAACADTPVPANTLRLPASQAEGDIPKIALTTGNRDALECLIRKLGIDPSEFTNPEGTGRINYFAGHGGTNRYAAAMNAGAQFPTAQTLWGSLDSLRRYDVVLLSCEGDTYPMEKGNQAFRAMYEYANLGGRVFASHWHQVWFQRGPEPFPQVANFVSENDLGRITANVVTTFPKGQALSEWLVNVQASPAAGSIPIDGAQYTVVSENPMYAQRWIANTTPESVQYLSANTPLGAPQETQCGRVVLSDIHVAGDEEGGAAVDRSAPNLAFPDGCVTSGLSPQEKVLAFMLFDISACLIPDDDVPLPPVIPR
jgi:hypothetical protein